MSIPDNYDQWESHERDQEQWFQNRLVCEDCHKPIQDDFHFEVEGDILCEDCMNHRYRKEDVDYDW
jgi:formylmethanofuran dehydrogenase subunit E